MIRVLKFETKYTPGPDGMKATDWVLLAPIGAEHKNTQTWKRVANIRPPAAPDDNLANSQSFMDMQAKWAVVGPAFDAWKTGQDIPEDGTPLETWAALSTDQVRFLKDHMSVRTVEEVAGLNDNDFAAMPFPNARKLPDLATKFLRNESASAKDAQISDLQAKVDQMAEMLAAQASEPTKRPRGRPPKTQPEVEEA